MIPLSPRQQQVLDRIVRGMTSKEIAADLGLAVPTVKMHTRVVLEKTGARNRWEAADRVRLERVGLR